MWHELDYRCLTKYFNALRIHIACEMTVAWRVADLENSFSNLNRQSCEKFRLYMFAYRLLLIL